MCHAQYYYHEYLLDYPDQPIQHHHYDLRGSHKIFTSMTTRHITMKSYGIESRFAAALLTGETIATPTIDAHQIENCNASFVYECPMVRFVIITTALSSLSPCSSLMSSLLSAPLSSSSSSFHEHHYGHHCSDSKNYYSSGKSYWMWLKILVARFPSSVVYPFY